MSRIVFQSSGVSELIRDMKGYTKELNKEIDIALTNNLEAVQKHARKNHRWVSRTGKLEQSVQVEQSSRGNTHTAKVFLNDKMTTAESGLSYGVPMHEGTHQGYDQSPIAPKYSHSTSKSGKGWKADPFLWRAIKQKWKMTRDLKKIIARLQKKYERA